MLFHLLCELFLLCLYVAHETFLQLFFVLGCVELWREYVLLNIAILQFLENVPMLVEHLNTGFLYLESLSFQNFSSTLLNFPVCLSVSIRLCGSLNLV